MVNYNTSDNNFGTAKWIVDPVKGQGTHTTIQAAINSASSGDTIFIRAHNSAYVENLTLKAGVNLSAFICDACTSISTSVTTNVTISGKMSASFAGDAAFSGINFQTNSDYVVEVTGSSATDLFFASCNFNGLNNSLFHYTSSVSGKLYFFDCTGNLDASGIAYFTNTNGDTRVYGGSFLNDGGSVSTSTVSGGSIRLRNCEFNNPLNISSSAALFEQDVLSQQLTNITAITLSGTSTAMIDKSTIITGSASSISIGSGCTATVTQTTINSSNTNCITGAGTLNYSNLCFTGSSQRINVTTQTGGVGKGGVFQAPSSGFIGEQIRSFIPTGSAVSLTSGVPANITSISLTAGIWDISSVNIFSGSTTISGLFQSSISTTSATLGTVGDNMTQFPFLTLLTTAVPLTIPSYRITLTATTTVYLVAQSSFTLGSCSSFGRISATRVG